MSEKEFDLESLPEEEKDVQIPEAVVDQEDIDDPMTPERERRIDFNWENDPVILNARRMMLEMYSSKPDDLLPENIKKRVAEVQKRKLIEKNEKEKRENE